MPDNIIFFLNAPKSLEDEVIDILMSFSDISGFNLKEINGYSKKHSLFDIAEQVEGFRSFCQFEVLLPSHLLPELKRLLTPICQPARLKYWTTAVVEKGYF